MLNYLTLGLPLLLLAALWPPYNVLIADAFLRKKYWMILAIIFSSLLGLSTSVFLMVQGAKLANINFNLVGGIFVLALGLRLFFTKENRKKKSTIGEHVQSLWTIFVVSFIPGVFSVTAAAGILNRDVGQVITVYLAGPLLGIFLGGILMAYGVKYAKLPLNRIGGILLLFIGIVMII